MKTQLFGYSFLAPDARPRITACGICGKASPWVEVEFRGTTFSAKASKSLVKRLKSIERANPV
jgi:epoxyqueuosine reductase QueG